MIASGCSDSFDTSEHFADPVEAEFAQRVISGKLKKADQLLEETQLDVSSLSTKEDIPLLYVVLYLQKKRAFKYLLEHGADPNVRGKRSVMILAAMADPHYYLRLLLKHGGDPNFRNNEGYPVLQYALSDLEKVEMLIENEADPNLKIGEFSNVLDAAMLRRSFDSACFLFEKGATLKDLPHDTETWKRWRDLIFKTSVLSEKKKACLERIFSEVIPDSE